VVLKGGLANSNLVMQYLKEGDLVRSKPIIKKIGIIAEQTNNEHLKAQYWARLSDYHLKNEKPQLAINALEEGLKVSIKLGMEIQKIDTYLDLAKL